MESVAEPNLSEQNKLTICQKTASMANQAFLLILVTLNIGSGCVSFWMGKATNFGDAKGYWLMAEGLRYGRFSSWFSLDSYYPETLRTPGYPMFLIFFRTLYDSELFIKLVQLSLYFWSLLLAYKIVRFLSGSNKLAPLVFLALAALNLQIPYYSGLISAEMVCIFFTILYFYILITKKQNSQNAIFSGVVAGLVFSARPSFLFFPFLLLLFIILFRRGSFSYFATQLLVFILTLIPFTTWNYKNHGIWKATPIEGGAGAAHLGYWMFKVPPGYSQNYYWSSVFGDDYTNPIALSVEDGIKNESQYEAEWGELLKNLGALLNQKHKEDLEVMKTTNPGIFLLYNSQYTLAREASLWALTVQHIKDDPWFYFKTRVYTFARFYFTGIDGAKVKENLSFVGTIKSIYPFLVTFSCVFMGLWASIIYFINNSKTLNSGFIYLLMMAIYQGAVHIPFAIQARYTVPAHFCILIMFSIGISHNETIQKLFQMATNLLIRAISPHGLNLKP